MHQEGKGDKSGCLLLEVMQGFLASMGDFVLECRDLRCTRRMFSQKLQVGNLVLPCLPVWPFFSVLGI